MSSTRSAHDPFDMLSQAHGEDVPVSISQSGHLIAASRTDAHPASSMGTVIHPITQTVNQMPISGKTLVRHGTSAAVPDSEPGGSVGKDMPGTSVPLESPTTGSSPTVHTYRHPVEGPHLSDNIGGIGMSAKQDDQSFPVYQNGLATVPYDSHSQQPVHTLVDRGLDEDGISIQPDNQDTQGYESTGNQVDLISDSGNDSDATPPIASLAVDDNCNTPSPGASDISQSEDLSAKSMEGASDGTDHEEIDDAEGANDDSDGSEDPFTDIRAGREKQDEEQDENESSDEAVEDVTDDSDDSSVGAEILQMSEGESDGDRDDDVYDQYTPVPQLLLKLASKTSRITKLRARMRRHDFKHRDKLAERRDKWRTEKRSLEARIKKLMDQLNRIHEPAIPWLELMDCFLRDRPDKDGEAVTWERVFRESCRQGNMSQKPGIIHPDLQWAGWPFGDQKLRRSRTDLLRDAALGRGDGFTLHLNDNLPLASVKPFRFNKLPISTQQRILEHLLVYRGGLTHCTSRLNKSNKPTSRAEFPYPSSGVSGYPHRFIFGTQRNGINRSWRPRDVLYPLLVSRRWLYLGIHIFYGMNTFAFSSLGELGRFFSGISQARAERVAHVELMWHGSIMPRHETRVNQRTLPLLWLTRMKRLQTLVVFIAEADKSRIRRLYEFPKLPIRGRPKGEWKRYDLADRNQDYTKKDISELNTRQSLLKRTATQPNWRGNRSMRTCHGMDYIYQLRGMNWVRFYEVDKTREHIRDWSFIDDINSVVTMPKDRRYNLESDLRNLKPLTGLEEYQPEDQDQAIITALYEPNSVPSTYGGSDTSRSDRGSNTTLGSMTSDEEGKSNSEMLDTDDDDDDDEPGHSLDFPDEWSDREDDSEDHDINMSHGSGEESGEESDPELDDDVASDFVNKQNSRVGRSSIKLDVDDQSRVSSGHGGNETAESNGDDDIFSGSDHQFDTQRTSQEEIYRERVIQATIKDDNNVRDEDGDEDEDDSLFVPLNRDTHNDPPCALGSSLSFNPGPSAPGPSFTTAAPTASDILIDLVDDDEDDDSMEVSAGLFVRSGRGAKAVPSVRARHEPGATPKARSFMSRSPPLFPGRVIIDLTGDDDEDDDIHTVSNEQTETSSVFAGSVSGASSIVKTESGSSDDARGRPITIDMTDDGNNDSRDTATKNGASNKIDTRDDTIAEQRVSAHNSHQARSIASRYGYGQPPPGEQGSAAGVPIGLTSRTGNSMPSVKHNLDHDVADQMDEPAAKRPCISPLGSTGVRTRQAGDAGAAPDL